MPSQRVPLEIGSQLATAKSPFISSESLTNCFVERLPNGAEGIYGAPGLVQYGEVGDGPIRGQFTLSGTHFSVSGAELYQVDANGEGTFVGAVAGYDPVDMSFNGDQLVIVSDATSYVYDSGSATYSQINDPDFRIASSTDSIDQYSIFTEKDSGVWFISELTDATNYDALQVQTAEAKPDKLVRVVVSNNEVLLMGAETVEGRYDSGASPFPFAKSSTSLDYGMIGKHAYATIDNTLAWIDNNRMVRTLRSATPVSISDPAIATLIQSWSDASVTQGFNLTIRGHEWLVLRNPEGCICWDATTGLWHARESHDSATWRVSTCTKVGNNLILGDATTNQLWRLDPDTYAEGSDPLVRTSVSRTLGPGGVPFTLDGVEIEVEVGVGLVSGQGSAPQIWMQLSRDGGRTYGARMLRSLGAIGNRTLRVMFTGPYGDFPPHGGVIKFGVSDPVRLAISRAWADVTPMQR